MTFSEDDVDSTFDVGVVLMDRSSDIAVRDGGTEMSRETPFLRKAVVHNFQMVCVHSGYVMVYQPHCELPRAEHSFAESVRRPLVMYL